ncbi:PREDICTED: uncharacterized protein LOC108569944 [Nicrophorus vespilloides]|uniref:Uncharacterized protein LOC108569944 n=1 Tax=Nicrophorus vespilloides TaxID=110193 RepID=A0ABM1NK64_NICVS|nr:PREDICTED: uncharacterized protein LOC108569944 [Nicrophorus vespilloides]
MALLENISEEPEVIYELIITIINVLSIIVNILLIVLIVRSRSMRTKTNMYILNVCAADLLTLLVLLLYYLDKRIVRYTYKSVNYPHIQCILSNLEISLQIITTTFVIIMMTNCMYNSKCISQGIVLVLMWNLIAVAFYVNIQYCRDELTLIQGAVYAVFITCLLLILCAKYYLRCKNRGDISRDGAFRLNFGTIFVCLCLFSWVVNIIAEFTFTSESIFKHFILAFGTSVKVGKNIALGFYLLKYNEMFKDSFLGLFNCRIVRINESVNYSTDRTSVDISISTDKI